MKKILDRVSLILLSASIVLFILAAVSLITALGFHFIGPTTRPPEFTFLEIGITLGLIGMSTLPLFIVTTLLALHHSKTGTSNDNNSERGTAGRGGPDREDQ